MNAVRQPAPMQQDALSEKRTAVRLPLRLPVQLLNSRHRETLESRDIGFRGIFLEGEPCLAPQSLARIALTHPVTGDAVIVHAVVVRVVPVGNVEGQVPGMGLELFAADRTVRTLWGTLVTYAHDQATRDDDARSGVRVAVSPRDRR